jgi:SAM-dependent methyltransferase
MSLLDKIYGLSSHYKCFRNKTIFDDNIGSSIYGEITQEGTNSLINYFKEYFNENTVFYDFGCGLGKMVFHIALLDIKKSVGIEYSKERYNGCKYFETIFCPSNKNIEFYNKSFLEHDYSDATIIYVDNTCFNDDINLKIYKNLPKGCLFIFKKNIRDITEKKNIERNLVKRTYSQSNIYWIIKE